MKQSSGRQLHMGCGESLSGLLLQRPASEPQHPASTSAREKKRAQVSQPRGKRR